jgi:YD repeat-containing protein
MVAIVSGNSLGLSLSSLAILGQRGQLGTAGQGRSGEQSFVNIANGNLVLQDRDDVLMGRGLDVQAVRTYNSQGLLSDDNGDNWNVGAFGQKVVLTSGTLGAAGSALTRTDRDGAQAVYTWDAAQSRYVSAAGSGAFDTIAYDSGASQLVWTDGDTGRIERYQSNGAGRLVSATDADGNTVSYAYNANGTVQSVTDANGDISYYDYSGTNLTQIRTVSGGVTTTTVRYAYDASNRLSKVTVDLSPGDNTVSDNDVYVTTYTYDGASKRVASVTQSDGTQLSFTYVQVGGVYKVATVTDALGAVTSFSYNAAQNTTTVTDPLGAQSVYLYDAQGQLLQVRSGVTAANATGLSQISYAYDAVGNVTLVTDGEGHKVTLQYDGRGNLTREVDSAGDTRVRTYNGANQLLTDTIYADAAVVDRAAFNKDAALPETTRYVYAAGNANRLRFAITPQGNVTEYRYDAYGQRTSTIAYAGAAYNTAALAVTEVPTEAQLGNWAAAQDLTRTELTELAYDARGQLSSSTTYAAVAANGSGVAGTAATTQYIYDPRGLLLQKIEPAATAGGATAVTTYTYDGLGRLLAVSAPSLDGGATPNTTVTSYDDAGGKTSVTMANGLVTVSAYDKAGRLVSVTQQSAGTGVLGTTTYAYDKDGNLLMTQDPTGVRKWMLYDEADRKIADINATGAVIEYVYNANGQLRETIAYTSRIGTAALVDGTGKPTTAWSATNTTTSLNALRPAGTAQDQKVWRFYDTANRLTWQVDALGYVTQTTYDGASRILSVTQLASPIDVAQLGNGANVQILVDAATVGGVTLGVSAGTSPLGSAVTLTASIAGTSPGGMVTFFSGSTIIGSAPVVNGVATLVTSELPVGANSIRAAYSGDVNRPASISPVAQKTITGATTSAALSFSPNPASYGQAVTMSAALTTTQPPGLAAATGEVKFYNGTTLIGTATIVNGLAMLTTSSLPVGSMSIRAEYAGDTTHAAAMSYQQSLTVNPNPTKTSLLVSGSSSALSLSATVGTAFGPSTSPGGTVTFYNGTTVVGSATLVNGVASIQIAGPASAAAFKAVYSGDAINASSNTLGPNGATVPSPTATSLTASATSVTQGQPVTLTAQVAGAAPGGKVTFFAGMQLLGTAEVVNGQATFVANYLPSGAVTVSAAYGGDNNNSASVIANGPVIQVAAGSVTAPAALQTMMRFDVAYPYTAESGVPFNATVSILGGQGGYNYTGTFTIFDGQTLVGSFMASSTSGSPPSVLLPPFLSQGVHNLKAVYSGDATRPACMSSGTQLTVLPVQPTVTVTSSRAQVTNGSLLQLTAKVSALSTLYQGASASGTATFYSNGTAIGTGTVVNGVATLTVSNLPLGTSSITVSYSGDANFKTITANGPSTQQVVASVQVTATTTTLTSSQGSGTYGAPLTLTASVVSSVGVLLTASGFVDFYNGNQLLGTIALVNGRAHLDISSLPVGVDALRAVYRGDEVNATSISNLSQSIAKAGSNIALTASATSVTQGQPVTLTAQVAGAAPGGKVTFFAGMQLLGTAEVVNGQATFVANYLPSGAVTVSAAYGGDNNNSASVIANGPVIQVAAGSVTAPAALQTMMRFDVAYPYTAESGVPFNATVSILGGQGGYNYTGTFTIFDGQTLVGSFMASSTSGSPPSVLLPPFLSQGVHNLKAVYSGDATRPACMSSGTQLTVLPVQPTVTVTSSRAQVTNGSLLQLTAKVSALSTLYQGASASGTATFYSNGTAIGTGTVVNGVATLTVSNLPLGTSSITVSYSGDGSYKVATSGSLSQQVVASPVTSYVSLGTTPATPVYGAPLTLTATPTGQGKPEGGSVSFYDGAVLLGTVALVNGKATLSVSNLEVGSHTIKAVYSGDANNATSTSYAYPNIAKAPAALTNLTAASIAKDGALSVQVGGIAAGGLVSFYEGIRLLGTAQVVNGVATLSGVALPPGTHSFTAAYAGDAHYLDGEVSFTQVVQGTPITTIYAALDILQDRTVTELYNRDGRLQGTLDAEGYLTEYKYNAAGELVQTIRYANRAADFASVSARIAAIAIARASYNLSGLRPGTNSSADINSYNLYDAQGRLVGQVDGEGYLTETTYDLRGNVIGTKRYANKAGAVGVNSTLASIRPAVNTAQDQTVTQTWSAANQLITRTNAEGTVTRFAYDSVGQLVQTITAVGTADERTSRALYDLQGRLIGQLDGRGSDAVALADPFALWAANGLTHAYDAAGRRTSTTDANGHRTLFFYDAIGRLRYTVNALGEVTESRYSAQGQLAEEVVYGTRVNVATLGATTPGGLNTATLASQLAAVADATKDTHVLHSYNATGTRASTTDALGSTTSYSYNAFREATASSYALKSGYVVTDTASYDRRGLQTRSVSDAATLAITRRQTYDAFGRVIERFDGNNNRSQVAYDRLGRVVTTIDALNGSHTTSYDAFDRVLTQRDALFNTTSYSYNTANRSTTVTTPEGVTMTTVRNRQGQTQSVTDGRGNTTSYSYDKSGNLLETSAPLGAATVTTGSTYDKTGLVLTSTDANGVVTSYTYDAVNRLLTRAVDPTGLNLVTTYGYDAKGQTVSVTDARGVVTATQYDLGGQLVRQAVDPTGLNFVTTYAYDTTGQVLRVTMPNGSVTQYTYDGAGRRVKEQVDPAGLNLTRSYEYDAAGNVTRSIDANGNATRYAYDANNRRVFMLDALGNLSKQEYDAEGRVTRLTSYAAPIDTTALGNVPTALQIQAKVVATAGSDVTESRRYDRDGRLAFSVDGTGAVVQYIYDGANNVVEMRAYANRINLAGWSLASNPPVVADAARDERVRTVYDSLNRASWRVDGTGGVTQYTRDANGNVVEARAYANAMGSAAFNAWNGAGAPTVAADATRDQRIRTVYDNANRASWSVDALGAVSHTTYDANGNVLETRAYATLLDATALAAWDGHSAPAPVADGAHDARVRNVYDAANRLSWRVDGTGAVQHTEYDGNGNVTRSRQYVNTIAYTTAPQSVVASDSDRIVDYLYDAANRLSYQLRWTNTSDQVGGATNLREVTSYVYDGVGHLVRQTAHAAPLWDYVGNNIGSVFNNLTLSTLLDQSQFMAYDAAGRLRYSVDGVGAVTRNSYDGTGRLIRTEQFARAIDTTPLQVAYNATGLLAPSLANIESRVQPDAGTDRITAFAHDGAGRRTFTVDALGSVSRSVYDAFGNVTQQIGYANRVAAPGAGSSYTEAALQAALVPDAGIDRIQRTAYDQANRQVFAVDALGAATESVYDGLGQEVETRRYARAIGTTGLSITASPSDIRARGSADAANDRISRQVFDAAGRSIYGVDPLGFVSKTDYDGVGRVRGTTQYALAIPAATANTAAGVTAAVVVHPSDRSKSFTLDAAGRVLSSIDPMGFTEAWSYTALGDKLSYTNARGTVWSYAYDRAGRMLQETSPQVELTAVSPGGDGRLQVDAAHSGVANVVTKLSYDAFGNLRSRTEAYGRPEQRTTSYAYDQVGRQVKVIYPPVGVYNPSSDTFVVDGLDSRHDTTQTLYTQTTYDALGNAIANRDIGGNYSYKTYDLVGRVAHEVDALGFVTGYARNTFGDAIRLTRYGAASGLAAGHPPSLGRAQVEAAVAGLDHSADRTLLNDYDRLGRAIQVTEPIAYVHDNSLASAQGFMAGKTTRNTYNTFGELAQVAQLKSAGNWTLTSHFYDRRGQQVASVDALGYLTTQAFDGAGNLAVHTEYAKAAAGWAGTGSLAGWTGVVNAGGTPPAAVADAANDRRTEIAYDRNNRKTSETRKNVEYSVASNGTSTRGDLTTSYGYDAVGNLTRTTDAAGASTYSYYDALGRVTAVAEPTRTSTVDGSALTPLTVFRRDAYGNVVMKTEYVNGADANGAPLAPSSLPPYALVPNPEVGLIEGSPVWAKEGSVGYIASAPFEGGTALYRINNQLFGKHLYTTSLSEYQSWLAMPNNVGEGIQGYVATTPQPGTVRLYRLTSAQPGFVDVVYTTSLAEVEALTTNAQFPYVVDEGQPAYIGGSAAGPFDAQLTRYVGPSLSFMTGFDHLYLPDRKPVDAWSDADTLARTDRTSYAQYDALGHTVQSTDAMGVNHYSSYNSQGLIAKEWQGVTDNEGATRTLYRAYQYDALGRQTHVLDPGTASDNASYVNGGAAASGAYTAAPGASVTTGSYATDESGAPIPGSNGKLTLTHLANIVNAQGGAFQVQFDFVTPDQEVPGGESGPTTEPGHAVTHTQTFLPGAATSAQGVTLVPNEPIASVSAIRILQQDGAGNWVLLWQGTPAQANGQATLNGGVGQPGANGAVVDTAMAYNAFGELVAKSVNGQQGEYFDYDQAGRLWRTNAGDGVDKIALYDLQGHQNAEIRSAGNGRGNLDLRTVGSADQADLLADVRRTDTTYDLLGHVTRQAMAERRETQGGVSAHTAMLGMSIAASSAPGQDAYGNPVAWAGTNSVALDWSGYLADLGSGQVKVVLSYAPKNGSGGEGAVRVLSQVFNAAQGLNGVAFNWTDSAQATEGGLQRIAHVTVYKQDQFGNWQALIDRSSAGYAGQSVHIAAPGAAVGPPPGSQVTMQLRPAGSTGDTGWGDVALVNFGDSLRYDAAGLPLGGYEYRVFTALPGQAAQITATGTLNITPRALATIATPIGVNAGAQTLEWQGPGAGDIQVIRLRVAGSSDAWVQQAIAHPEGNEHSVVNLAGLAAGTYEYELLWTHPGDEGPYAHATGQISKVAGVPGTPGTPAVPAQGLPHIDGLVVESRQEVIGTDEQSGDIYQTVYVVRLPPPPPGYISVFSYRFQGSPFVLQPVAIQQRPDGNWEANITGLHLSAGVYEYAYGFFPGLNTPASSHALGNMTVGSDGSVSIADTTPAYVPGTPGTPGTPDTPPQYGWAATQVSPYAISQDPLLGGRQIGQSAGLNGTDGWRRPIVNQNTDRWGNVLSISDPRSANWVTTYSYNANNQLIRQVQTDADGNAGADASGNIVNPNAVVTSVYYDQMGRQVAVRDANDHVNGQVWDAGGHLVQELHADGGVISHAYDAFGDKVRTLDAMGHGTWFTHDKLDRLLRTTHGAVDIWGWPTLFGPQVTGHAQTRETSAYDQTGRLLRSTNGAGETLKYAYDLRGNLIKTTRPMGQTVQAAYDALNRKTIEVDANGALATWKYTYFGQLAGHSDIGGANYAYSYDNARQLTQQTSTRGQNLAYSHDAAGQLVRIDDAGVGKTSTYAYDLSGRRLRETTVQGGVTYQDNHIAYDALGRMRWVADTRAYLSIDYDKVGNRTHIGTRLRDEALSTQQVPTAVEEDSQRYFQYDAMNRQTVVDAVDANGSLGTEGHRLTYDLNGNRASDTRNGIRIVEQGGTGSGQWVAEAGESTEVYGYDALNRLTSTVRDGALVDSRGYDGANRVVSSGPGAVGVDYINLHRQWRGTTGNDALQGRQNLYDANGQLVHQKTLEYLVAGSAVNYEYDAAGNVLGYLVADTVNNTFTHTANTVVRAEGYRTAMSFSATTAAATGALLSQGGLGYGYDANGHLNFTGDSGQMSQPTLRTHNFVNDASGNALYAYYAYEGAPQTQANQVNGQRQLIVNGEVLGRYGLMADHRFEGTPLAQNGPFFSAQSDFSFGYQPIDGNYPAGSPGTYAVGAGDTLQSIAKGAYGDASLWYLIADANGLSSNADLRTGQVLTISTRVASANNAGTFKPYDPSKIASDTPTMMATPQAQGGGCGAIGQIIMIVVAVVATIFTAGAATVGLSAGFGSIMSAGAGVMTAGAAGGAIGAAAAAGLSGAGLVATAAAAGAVGSIVSQGVGIAIGAQNEFSWKGVALSAIAGGASAGVGAALGPVTSTGFDKVLAFAGRGALTSAVTQGISVATGLQDSFSWKGVAASAVGAGVGAAVSSAVGPAFGDSTFGQFATRATSGFAAGVTAAAMRGGRVSVTQVATDAFGNALGDSLAAANSSIPGPVGAAERAGIMGMFDGYGLAGSSAGPTQSLSAADVNWILAGTAPANPYADLSMSGGVQLAGETTGGMLFGKSGQLTPDGPYIDLPKTRVSPALMEAGSLSVIYGEHPLPEITVSASAEDDGSYDASEAARLSNYPAPSSGNSYPFANIDFMAASRASVEADKATALNELKARIARGPVLTPTTGLPARQLTAGEMARANSFQMQAGRSTAQAIALGAMASPPGLVASTGVAAFGATTNLQQGNYGAAAWNAAEIGMNFAGAGVLSKIGKPVALGDSPETALSSLLRNGTVPESLGRTTISPTAQTAIGVPVTRSANPLSPVREFDAFGNEIMYRSMSRPDFEHLENFGVLRPTKETFISPDFGYSSKYTDNNSVTVRFATEPGTSAALQEIGIAAGPRAAQELGLVERSGEWMQTNTRFKVEKGVMNTGLGQGPGITIFNRGIVDFERVR